MLTHAEYEMDRILAIVVLGEKDFALAIENQVVMVLVN